MKKDPAFKRRFYTSTFFDAQGKESLQHLYEDFHPFVGRVSIYNHANKHGTWSPRGVPNIGETPKAFNERSRETTKAITALKKYAPEKVLEGDVYDPKAEIDEDWEDTLEALIKQGSKDLKSGRLKVNAGQLVTALKIKADRENAKNDKGNSFIAAMALMATGAKSATKE